MATPVLLKTGTPSLHESVSELWCSSDG